MNGEHARASRPARAPARRKRTDKYGSIGCAVPRERCDGPPLAIAVPRRLDPPPPLVLDASETPRERERRLTLARARFVHDERERARRRGVMLAVLASEHKRTSGDD